ASSRLGGSSQWRENTVPPTSTGLRKANGSGGGRWPSTCTGSSSTSATGASGAEGGAPRANAARSWPQAIASTSATGRGPGRGWLACRLGRAQDTPGGAASLSCWRCALAWIGLPSWLRSRAMLPTAVRGGKRTGPRSAGFVQAWPQRGEVAWPRAGVELVADDPLPGGSARRRGAGQGEQERAVGQAGEGPRLQRGGADLLERDRAEQFAEAGHRLVQQRQQRLGRGVAAGEAGATADQDAVDGLVGDPLRHQGAHGIAVVGQQGALDQAMAVGLERGGEVVAGGIFGEGARVGDGQHA